MDVAVKTIMKKNIPKTQSLLKKEIDILRVNIILFRCFIFFHIKKHLILKYLFFLYMYVLLIFKKEIFLKF